MENIFWEDVRNYDEVVLGYTCRMLDGYGRKKSPD